MIQPRPIRQILVSVCLAGLLAVACLSPLLFLQGTAKESDAANAAVIALEESGLLKSEQSVLWDSMAHVIWINIYGVTDRASQDAAIKVTAEALKDKNFRGWASLPSIHFEKPK